MSVWNGSGHFEYIKSKLHGLDINSQPIKGNLTAHVRTATVLLVYSFGIETLSSDPA